MSPSPISIRRVKNIAHFLLALTAINYYRNPSKRLKIIGVTGTDGKTTTANYIYQLLEKSGRKAALISTVGVFMGGKKEPLGFHVTTPSTFILNKYLRKAVKKNIEFIVLEVSSHALDQYRVYGINFEVSTITNVTKEHLDYHKNIENYLNTKIKLLQMSKKSVLNLNDPFFKKIVSKVSNEIYTYSLSEKADLNYASIKNKFTEELTEYNKRNLLAAVLVLWALGISEEQAVKEIDGLLLPEGRLEYLQTSPFKVIIDFAHTPNAFNSLLPEVRAAAEGRLIHVFGSAGKRDKSKRPDMGEVASKYDDIIILTGEDSRGENIDKINSDIRKGIDSKFRLVSVVGIDKNNIKNGSIIQIDDRKEAIRFAIEIAKNKDSVVITGKGPEESMNMGNGETMWNDISETKKLLKNE